MNKKNLGLVYEMLFSGLAFVSVTIAICDLSGKINLQSNSLLYIVDSAIWIVFIADYLIRLVLASSKKEFIQGNIPDLIAIIPFSAFFKVFRLAKLLRLVKLTRLTKITRLARIFALFLKFEKNCRRFLRTNGLNYMLMVSSAVILLGAVGIYIFERGSTVNTFGDAVWWSFVTATTVGYGDISPSSVIGRIIAAVLMLCGIGTIGLLTGTIATYFLGNREEHIAPDTSRSVDLSDLSDDRFRQVLDFIEFIRKK